MEFKTNPLTKLFSSITTPQNLSRTRLQAHLFLRITLRLATCSTKCQAEPQPPPEPTTTPPNDPIQLLMRWGCSESDISTMLTRRPSLRKADHFTLRSKLQLLSGLGLQSSDLVKIINCRPRFLSCRLNHSFDERIEYFTKLFGSKEMLCKAIIRNPSLLTYDFHCKIKPVIALYDQVGVANNSTQKFLKFRSPTSFQQQLQLFWRNQMQEVEQTNDFKNHSLPLAHIKKIMKADEDVQMISAEASILVR